MDENVYNIKQEAIDISTKDIHANLSEDFRVLQQAATVFLAEIINIYNSGSRNRKNRRRNYEVMKHI